MTTMQSICVTDIAILEKAHHHHVTEFFKSQFVIGIESTCLIKLYLMALLSETVLKFTLSFNWRISQLPIFDHSRTRRSTWRRSRRPSRTASSRSLSTEAGRFQFFVVLACHQHQMGWSNIFKLLSTFL